MKKVIPYGRQWITAADIAAVKSVLSSDYLTQGPKVQQFEEAFAHYVGSRYAVAVSSGTAALHLSALALGVNAQSRVISTPFTFVATANCVTYCGGQVDFADIDPHTGIMQPEAAERLLRQAPAGTYQGLIVVDYAGYPADMEAFRRLANRYNLWLLQDAAHATGGYFHDSQGRLHRCGNGRYAELTTFSFHPVKHIACGEGGMITTNDEALYRKLMQLRTHGITKERSRLQQWHGPWYYEMQQLGYNYRLSDIHAALGLSQLDRMEEALQRRRAIARRYDEAFRGTHIRPLKGAQGHAWHLYVVRVPGRKAAFEYMRAHNIFVQVHYIPVYLQPYYRERLPAPAAFPGSEELYGACFSLPIYPTLTAEEQTYVIEKLLSFNERI